MDDHAALKTYRAKRDFRQTSEPRGGGRRSAAGQLSFVVQKHWASRLHYDFRLEWNGSMKSWAVPKGPSFDAADKRLAVQVEDHPISYSSFEGQIPEGQYGAGKVVVWDKGYWTPLADAEAGLSAGNLKFELHGHKLQGRWALVRMHGKGGERQPPWLLVKEKDGLERPAAEFSVVDEMPDSVRRLKMPAPPGDRARAPRAPEVPEAELPATLAPQLATLVAKPPADPAQWIYEIKFDGYRLLARLEGRGRRQQVQLFTRNGNDWTHKLKALQAELRQLNLPEGWYDGEIVVLDHNGLPDFGALQLAFDASRTRAIVYYLFDLPFCGGHDLRAQPLQARRALLQSLLEGKASESVFFSAAFEAPPGEVVSTACGLGLEGVIAKRKDAPYVSRRSDSWIKLKCSQRQEFVVVGTTDPQGSRSGFGALLLAVHGKDGRLTYAGKVGTGFDQATLKKLARRLADLATPRSPLADTTGVEGRPHWVRPELVAEVTFGEWTRGGRIRHAVFHGLRSDKPAEAIVRERAAAPPKAAPRSKAPAADGGGHALSTRLKVTHGERVVDASTGITKMDLVRYYALVGDLMMAHLKDRPVALVRAPAGIGRQLFFQKHAEVEKLPGLRQLDPALDPEHPAMLAVASARGLLSAAQWNMVELHSMNAQAASFERPDRLVFDLDPGEGVRWRQMQEAAELVHAFLQQLGLPAFLKTSGGKGLHVVVPIKRLHGWGAAKGFAQAVVQHLARTIPDRFVAKSGPRNRVGRIFVDYLRNGQGATTVCAWSARARPGMGISVPLAWDELASLKSSDQWTVRNVHERLDMGNAPWEGYARAAKSLKTAMKTLGFDGA